MGSSEVSYYSIEIQDILKQFSEEEIISLAKTVTGGLLKHKINTREGAFDAILHYSEDLPSILRRKVFTREKLLSYLYDKKIPVKLPITKPEIINTILRFWRNNSKNERNYETTEENIDYVESNDSSNDSNEEQITDTVKAPQNNTVVEQNTSQNQESLVLTLAEQFSQWFYKLLNDNQLTPEHFFPDASLTLNLTSNENIDSKTISNDHVAVTNCLLTIKNQYELYFNPNLLKDNLKAQMDSHGLVMIIASGTLHNKEEFCIGVFDQMFALARDPFAENNWKIKRTDLNLKSGSGCSVKQLTDGDNSSIAVT